mmetsp:Transcript_3340/g.5574  ORF Transcript_3340/g.5574 Transcript_3340/m.5574 type:complete len:275 (-) Transcript_3340:32-856(-)
MTNQPSVSQCATTVIFKPPLLRVCCLNHGGVALQPLLKSKSRLSLQGSHVSRHRISVASCCRGGGSGARLVGCGCLRQRGTLRFSHLHMRSSRDVSRAGALAALGAVRLRGLRRGGLGSGVQGGTCRSSLRALGHAPPRAGALPGRCRFALLQTLDATHLAGGQVGLDARGVIFKVHLKVVPAQGITKWLIRAAIKGLVPWHPWAPTFLQLDHPVVVSLIGLGTRRGQEVAGGQIAIRLCSICWHLWAHFRDLNDFKLDLVDAVHAFVNTKVGH